MSGPRLRVLLVAPASDGGIGFHVRDLADELVRRRDEVTVVAPRETLRRFAFADTGAHVVAAPVGRAHPAAVQRTRRVLRMLAPHVDVVHAHGVRAGAIAGLARISPLVVTWHNAPLGGRARRLVHRTLEQFCARRCDIVLCASADLAERARSAGARRITPFTVAAPRRDEHAGARACDPLPVDLRTRAAGRPVVLSVARLHRQKRVDVLIDALADRDDLAAFVVGDGPLRANLEKRARECRAPVSFLGRRDDVTALLAQVDVFVLASDWEARPLAVQEAMRAGVAVVATDVGGVRELVGDAAALVPPGDPRALAVAIDRLLADGAARETVAAAGRARAGTWLTVVETVDVVRGIYLDLAITDGRPAPEPPGSG